MTEQSKSFTIPEQNENDDPDRPIAMATAQDDYEYFSNTGRYIDGRGWSPENSQLPDFCFTVLEETWDGTTAEVIAIKHGETGYWPTTYGRQTREWVDEMNLRIDVRTIMRQAYEVCSLFGNWSRLNNVVETLTRAIGTNLCKGKSR